MSSTKSHQENENLATAAGATTTTSAPAAVVTQEPQSVEQFEAWIKSASTRSSGSEFWMKKGAKETIQIFQRTDQAPDVRYVKEPQFGADGKPDRSKPEVERQKVFYQVARISEPNKHLEWKVSPQVGAQIWNLLKKGFSRLEVERNGNNYSFVPA